MKDKVYNLIGLAEQLRLPAKWLKEQADEGKIPCLCIGKQRLFNLKAVERALSRLAARRYKK